MRAALVLAMVLASFSAHAGPAPPDEIEQEAQRARFALYVGKGLSCGEIAYTLRLWYGRYFTAEYETPSKTCNVYVITSAWDNSTLRQEVIHRAHVGAMPMQP